MPHKPQLDGLRFVAFLAVFYFHARPGKYFWGPEGVRIFFTISGFLITRILIQSESGNLRADLGRFYVRRTLRIFPLYYAVVAGLWASGLLPGVWWYLTYLYNIRAFLDRAWGGPVGHFWSLCVEEQFYVLYPLALLLTPPRFRFAMLGALLVGSKAFQAYAHSRLPMPWAGFLLPYCGEHLIWGCLAGLVELRTKPGRWEGPLALLAGVPLALLTRIRPEWIISSPGAEVILANLSGFGLGSALVVFGLWRTSNPWIVGPLAWKPIAYLGKISYGLYVYHLLVIERDWLSYLPESYLFRFREPYGELALTIAVSAASWRFFEAPINRLKDRLTGPAPTRG
jgi:peptidoglycan/LPS O-acetylase OafA/YrhL